MKTQGFLKIFLCCLASAFSLVNQASTFTFDVFDNKFNEVDIKQERWN